MTLTAVAVPMAEDNVDTDQIFPARFYTKDRKDGQYGSYFLHDQRFDENGERRAGYILNDPRLSGAKIIVAGANYGCGSGRPGAIFSHLDFGIRAVIAESFGPVFSSVAYKSGLLTIVLGGADLKRLRDTLAGQIGATITIDLPRQRIVGLDGAGISFEIDHFVKRMIMEGLSEIDLTLGFEDKIKDFEARQRISTPWALHRGSG